MSYSLDVTKDVHSCCTEVSGALLEYLHAFLVTKAIVFIFEVSLKFDG